MPNEKNETENPEIVNEEEEDEEGIGDPVAVSTHCLIEQATAIVRCSNCGTRCRINLLAEESSQCPGCETQYSSALLITEPDDVDAVTDLISTIDGADEDETDNDQADNDQAEIPDARPAARQENPAEQTPDKKPAE